MKQWTVTMRTRDGDVQHVLEAPDERAARTRVRTLVERSGLRGSILDLREHRARWNWRRWLPFGAVPLASVAQFFTQYSVLYRAGVRPQHALEALVETWRCDESFWLVLVSVLRAVNEGAALSVSMRRHPEVFPEAACAALRAAEEAPHTFGEALRQVEIELQSAVDMTRAWKLAVLQPLGKVVFCILAGLVMAAHAVEVHRSTSAGSVSQLVQVADSPWTSAAGALLLGFLLSLAGGCWWSLVSERGHTFQALLRRLPALDRLQRAWSVARVCRTLSTVLAVGVPLERALGLAAQSGTHPAVAADLRALVRGLRRGETLQALMAEPHRSSLYPSELRHWLSNSSGETLVRGLARLSDWMRQDVHLRLDRFRQLVEPAALAVLGMLILLSVLLTLAPLVHLASAS